MLFFKIGKNSFYCACAQVVLVWICAGAQIIRRTFCACAQVIFVSTCAYAQMIRDIMCRVLALVRLFVERGGAHIPLSIDFLKATSSVILHSVPNNLKSFRKYSNIFEVSKIVLELSTILEVSVVCSRLPKVFKVSKGVFKNLERFQVRIWHHPQR